MGKTSSKILTHLLHVLLIWTPNQGTEYNLWLYVCYHNYPDDFHPLLFKIYMYNFFSFCIGIQMEMSFSHGVSSPLMEKNTLSSSQASWVQLVIKKQK